MSDGWREVFGLSSYICRIIDIFDADIDNGDHNEKHCGAIDAAIVEHNAEKTFGSANI